MNHVSVVEWNSAGVNLVWAMSTDYVAYEWERQKLLTSQQTDPNAYMSDTLVALELFRPKLAGFKSSGADHPMAPAARSLTEADVESAKFANPKSERRACRSWSIRMLGWKGVKNKTRIQSGEEATFVELTPRRSPCTIFDLWRYESPLETSHS